jgi:hypothetical protein
MVQRASNSLDANDQYPDKFANVRHTITNAQTPPSHTQLPCSRLDPAIQRQQLPRSLRPPRPLPSRVRAPPSQRARNFGLSCPLPLCRAGFGFTTPTTSNEPMLSYSSPSCCVMCGPRMPASHTLRLSLARRSSDFRPFCARDPLVTFGGPAAEMRLWSITAHPEYEQLSFEELRWQSRDKVHLVSLTRTRTRVTHPHPLRTDVYVAECGRRRGAGDQRTAGTCPAHPNPTQVIARARARGVQSRHPTSARD